MKQDEKLHANVNGFKDYYEEWVEEWEIADTEEKESHVKHWVDLPPRTDTRQKNDPKPSLLLEFAKICPSTIRLRSPSLKG